MIDKHYITPQELYLDSLRLAEQIVASGFQPDFMVALWRGGTPIGIVVHEYLKSQGISPDHISIRTERYDNTKIDQAGSKVKVVGLEYIVKKVNDDDSLLIVDDVFDTGLTIQAVIKTIKKKARKNTPEDIRIATVYYKPTRNETKLAPNFYVHETEKWLVYPHELMGLTPEELATKKIILTKG